MTESRAPLAGRFVLLGVTGSIAAYKAAELVRLLTTAGADVQVLITPTAAHFIGPLTMETLSRRRVMLDPLELLPDHRIGHIVAADAADAILVAPATDHAFAILLRDVFIQSHTRICWLFRSGAAQDCLGALDLILTIPHSSINSLL